MPIGNQLPDDERLHQPNSSTALPQTVNVAIGSRVQHAGFADLHRSNHLMVRVCRTLFRPLGRFPVGTEFEIPDLNRKLVTFRMIIQRNPADMMFSGIGMRDFFTQRDGNIEYLARFDLVRSINYRNMLL
jgi:hypothetical protein